MKTMQIYADLISAQDRLMRLNSAPQLREIDPLQRAQTASYYLGLALNQGVSRNKTCCSIARILMPEIKDDKEQFLIGWNTLYPLCKENYLTMERDSKFQKTEAALRSKIFKAYYDSLNDKKKEQFGDWSPQMYVVPDTKRANLFIDELINSVSLADALSDKSQLWNEKPEDWTGLYHPLFGCLVSNPNRKMKRFFNSKKCERVLRAVNKLQGTGLRINAEVLARLKAEKRNILKELKESLVNEDSYMSKYYELERIISLAEEHVDKLVYSPVFLDFRGRCYFGAAYLNRSSCDYAKGLLTASEGVELGDAGWDNLIIGAVDYRDQNGEAKLSKADKLVIAERDLDEFIAVGNGDNSWLQADEPTQYLGVCIDIANAYAMGNDFDQFKSAVFLSRDASQSGSMLMGIATQDPKTMKYTNVLKSDVRYDLYTELGGIMLELLKQYNVEPSDKPFEEPVSDKVFDQVLALHRNKKHLLIDAKNRFLELFKDNVVLRKWAKYPTMLAGFNAQEWCIAEDLWNKLHEKYDWLTPVHCKLIADLFYKSYEIVVPACFSVMNGLSRFGTMVHKMDEDVLMFGSYSGFPFMQNYYKSTELKFIVKFKGKQMKVVLRTETKKRDYHSTKSSTPANTVHSWDKELLFMFVNRFEHVCSVNHDAFFAVAAHIDRLGEVLREATWELGTKYDLLGDSLSRYNLQPSDLDIVKRQLDSEFCPQCNEYCYS